MNSQPCPLGLSLTGVYLMNCSYHYQSSGHQHCSAAHGPHLSTSSLTQLLAVVNRRRRQARDPAGVTPEVLVLCCRGNVPHLHCRIAAKRREVEGERTWDANPESYREREMSDENKLKTLKCKSQGGKIHIERLRQTNPCQSEGVSGNMLGDKLGELFTLRILYVNQGFFSCITFQKPPSCQQQPRR